MSRIDPDEYSVWSIENNETVYLDQNMVELFSIT